MTHARPALDSGLDRPRYPLLDALRGLSILLVVILHFQIRIPLQEGVLFRHLPRVFWYLVCRNGGNGVRMFFVISGFVITLTSLERWGALQAIDVKGFYRLRFARIAPLLLALLGVLGVLHALGVPGYVIDPPKASYARALVSALALHLNWLEAQRGYLPASWDVLWSLSVEELFYVGFPLVCLAFRWRRVALAAFLLLFLAGPFVRIALADEPIWQSKAYLACMDSIALGCLTALWARGRTVSRALGTTLGVCGAAAVLAVLMLEREPSFRPVSDLGLGKTLLSLGVAALLVAGIREPPTRSAPVGLRVLSAYGRLSYEIYLTHCFVVLTAVRVYKQAGWSVDAAYPLLAVTLAASWSLGALVERSITTPSNRWLRTKHGERRR